MKVNMRMKAKMRMSMTMKMRIMNAAKYEGQREYTVQNVVRAGADCNEDGGEVEDEADEDERIEYSRARWWGRLALPP